MIDMLSPRKLHHSTPITLPLILFILILFFTLGCGGSDSVAVNPPQPVSSQRNDSSSDAATSLAVEVPLPGFVPNQVALIPPQLIVPPIPIPILSDNYAITWSSDVSEGKTIAQSRSKVPVTLDPCALPIVGERTLTATVYHPLDFPLFFPLATQTVDLEIDPGCYSIELEATLPEETNDGISMTLTVNARILDSHGDRVVDGSGNQPPVDLSFTATHGTVGQSSGQTNALGQFSTTGRLT